MEAFAVSIGIALPQDIHPLSRLLRPHFEGTINITDFATTDLINIRPQRNHGGVFDHNFTGTMASNIKFIAEETFGLYGQNTLRSNPQLARRSANLFNDSIFPKDIVRRGVGHFIVEKIRGIVGGTSEEIDIVVHHAHPGAKSENGLGFSYPHLEDGCQLWNAITDWVCRYVSVYYKSNDDVKNDCELQAWAKTVVEGGKILGFGEYQNGHTLQGQIPTRAYFVQALSSIIFTASAQHSAVIFPQAEHAPSMPVGIYHDFFEGGSADVHDYLPNEAHFKEAMETASLLSASQLDLSLRVIFPVGDERVLGESIIRPMSKGVSIISDIDDTIKISQVTDKELLVENTFLKPFKTVPVMADVYARWFEEGVTFHWVSSSPYQLYPVLDEFMDAAGFPPGSFHLKHIRAKDKTVFNLLASSEKNQTPADKRTAFHLSRTRFHSYWGCG